MATLTIRNIDDETKARLRIVAANAGHSMEEHVRALIASEVANTVPRVGFGTWANAHFANTGSPTRAKSADLIAPARKERARPAKLPR